MAPFLGEMRAVTLPAKRSVGAASALLEISATVGKSVFVLFFFARGVGGCDRARNFSIRDFRVKFQGREWFLSCISSLVFFSLSSVLSKMATAFGGGMLTERCDHTEAAARGATIRRDAPQEIITAQGANGEVGNVAGQRESNQSRKSRPRLTTTQKDVIQKLAEEGRGRRSMSKMPEIQKGGIKPYTLRDNLKRLRSEGALARAEGSGRKKAKRAPENVGKVED